MKTQNKTEIEALEAIVKAIHALEWTIIGVVILLILTLWGLGNELEWIADSITDAAEHLDIWGVKIHN